MLNIQMTTDRILKNQKVRRILWLLTFCVFALYLAAPAFDADPAAGPSGLRLASGGIIIGSPEIYIPKTPPDQPGTSMEQTA